MQSSNTVYVLQPLVDPLPTEGRNEICSTLSAISQCAFTLELVPWRPPSTSILKASLPVWSGAEPRVAENDDKAIRDAIRDDVPFSSAEFDTSWKAICAFEFEGKSWYPSPSVLLDIWRSMMLASTIQGLRLDAAFDPDSLYRAIDLEIHPKELYNALLIAVCDDHQAWSNGCKFFSGH